MKIHFILFVIRILMTVVLTITTFSFYGYLSGTVMFYHLFNPVVPMAFTTALCLMMIAIGIILLTLFHR